MADFNGNSITGSTPTHAHAEFTILIAGQWAALQFAADLIQEAEVAGGAVFAQHGGIPGHV